MARETIEWHVRRDGSSKPSALAADPWAKKIGVFVTINDVNGHDKVLRGCIGFPQASKPLSEALGEAAVGAATNDPRFQPITENELGKITVGVSVLTKPELISVGSPTEYPSNIKVGEDGLILKWSRGSGLFLPQVPVEYDWDAEEFLGQVCMKANLTPDFWLTSEAQIYKFQAIVFEEVSPRGVIIRRKPSEDYR